MAKLEHKEIQLQLNYSWEDNSREESLLLIHSLGTNLTIWDQVLEALSKEYNLLTLDLRGHGQSDPPTSTTSIKDYAMDVEQIIDHIGVGQLHVIGLCLGGLIAQYLAIYKQTKVGKLIVSNSAPKIGSKELWNERIDAFKEFGLEGLVDSTIERSFTESFKTLEIEQIENFRKMFLTTSSEGYIAACESLRDEDLRTETKRIKAETLFIGGEEDQVVTAKYVEDHSLYIRNSKAYIMPGVGHLPCFEKPKEYVEIIRQFLHLEPA